MTITTSRVDAFRNMFAILHNLETSDLPFMDAEQRRMFFNDPCVAILRLDDARLDALYALVQSKQPARYKEPERAVDIARRMAAA